MMAATSLAQVPGQKSHEKVYHDQQSIFKDVMAGNSPGFSGGHANSQFETMFANHSKMNAESLK